MSKRASGRLNSGDHLYEGTAVIVAILTIFVGAISAAGGAQELVVQGILNNQRIPLIGGTLGAVVGALLLSAGIALLRQSPRANSLTRAAAIAALPAAGLIGQLGWGLAGWPMTLLGLAWPLVLLFHIRGGRPMAQPIR